MKRKIYLSSPTIHAEEKQFVKEAFDTNWVAPLGPNVNKFEEELARYMEKSSRQDKGAGSHFYAAALSAGTAAIHLALINAGIGEGDLVFCSDLTFSATCNPILYQKARPVFIDSERETWNMDPEQLRRAFSLYPEVKAVIVVNLYGTPARLDKIARLCRENGVTLIEDAAESLGASYQGRQTGTFGEQGIFSFNGNKIITSSGGGMLISTDEEKIKHARFLATQAREPARHYEHREVGYNYRMSNIVAGIGRGQLLHLNEHIGLKKRIYDRYRQAFAGLDGIQMNPVPADCRANYWLSCALLDAGGIGPEKLLDALERDNIEARPIWKPMHQQLVFEKYGFVTDGAGRISGCEADNSVSGDIFKRGLCLPSDIKNTEEDMDRITGIIRKVLN